MASRHRLHHSDDLVSRAIRERLGMRQVGGNVAYAVDVPTAHQALLNSTHHREILDSSRCRRSGSPSCTTDAARST